MGNKSKIYENIVLITQIGLSMSIPIIGGIIFGNFLDKKFNTNVIFLSIFTIIGVFSSFTNLFKFVNRGNKRK